jgi:hypothetical protein
VKIAYLLFVYKNPKLIERTIQHLSCADSAFFVHVDKKSNIDEFAPIRGKNVFFSEERLTVYWAEFSGVEAILLLMRQALAVPEHYDYFVLLSGSEYPLRSRSYIHRFLEEHRGTEFMTMDKVPAPGKPLSRINTLRFPSNRPVARFVFRLLAKFGLGQRDYRKYLGQMEAYSGLTWWAVTREACQYIVDRADQEKNLKEFFENTFAPEESFFHTILGNSPFQARLRRNLVFEDWSKGGAGPEMINEEHCKIFETQDEVCVGDLHGPGELLFARKFSDHDLHLIDRIDQMIQRKEKL